MKDGRVVLGKVGTDSGMVAFCDPAGMGYLSYDQVVQSMQHRHAAVLTNRYGVEVGVTAGTGIGDGEFPVTGYFRDGALESVTVHFQLPKEAR